MARRSSARLRNSSTTTPQRVSLSHDAPISRTPRTVPAKLAALRETDEVPGAFPASASPKSTFALYPVLPNSLALPAAATPSKDTPIKPESANMHPQRQHQTTAKPRDEARHLGFSNIVPHTEPPKQVSKIATLQATPTKARNLETDTTGFQFTFQREHSLELSPEAKRLMYDKREEAARIREQMTTNGEGIQSIDEVIDARRIAKPKGRFSQAHLREFEKMQSIGAHASTLRMNRSAASSYEEASATKSLKRSPSKAGLDQPSPAPSSRPHSRDGSKPVPAVQNSQSASSKDLREPEATEPASPAKRMKRTTTDDISTTRPSYNDDDKPMPSTPQTNSRPHRANLSHLTTPTQASIARAASVKSSKGSKIPAPSLTPAKTAATHLKKHQIQAVDSPALLAQSPLKPSQITKQNSEKLKSEKPASSTSPLLSRSPVKAAFSKNLAIDEENDEASKVKAAPLLSRSPLKPSVPKASEATPISDQTSPTPLLARSPSKLPAVQETVNTPGEGTPGKLLGRFNLLCQSPMKSILRSPQRLYSDDPAKIAAGTHLATPPKVAAGVGKFVPAVPFTTAPVQKHVDFTSSTKARQAKTSGSTPSKTPTPSPKPDRTVSMCVEPANAEYPDLSRAMATLSPSPQKRRQTSGPGDFTFRSGDQDIVFGQSPNAVTSAATGRRSATIRVVSAGPEAAPAQAAGSKKRKFDFENRTSTETDVATMTLGKENTPVMTEDDNEQRPAKRTKPSAPEHTSPKSGGIQPTPASAARRTTLGVKPKGVKNSSPVKRPTTISKSRLNALAQPKRR